MTLSRTLARLLALATLWASVELLERVAYAAGVDDAAGALLSALDDDEDLADDYDPRDVQRPGGPLDDVDDLADLAPLDLTDVIPGPWQTEASA